MIEDKEKSFEFGNDPFLKETLVYYLEKNNLQQYKSKV